MVAIPARTIPIIFENETFSARKQIAITEVTRKLRLRRVEAMLTLPPWMEVMKATKATAAIRPEMPAYQMPFEVMCLSLEKYQIIKVNKAMKTEVKKVIDTESMSLPAIL